MCTLNIACFARACLSVHIPKQMHTQHVLNGVCHKKCWRITLMSDSNEVENALWIKGNVEKQAGVELKKKPAIPYSLKI